VPYKGGWRRSRDDLWCCDRVYRLAVEQKFNTDRSGDMSNLRLESFAAA